MAAETLAIEVAYALPSKQHIVALRVPEGTTARQAVVLANLPSLFPDISGETFAQAPLGIFGKALRDPDTQRLREGDRVEVYRPLAVDPKAARLERAKRQASEPVR
jgi:putative ubiquitin-RnfH superfamily antitoxin RatB of RatAB toxin-antitoxin module